MIKVYKLHAGRYSMGAALQPPRCNEMVPRCQGVRQCLHAGVDLPLAVNVPRHLQLHGKVAGPWAGPVHALQQYR